MARANGLIHPLPHLRRGIVLRLALCGLLIAGFAGALAYWLETQRLDTMVADFAADQARHLAHSLEGKPAEHDSAEGGSKEFLIARLEIADRLPVEVRRTGVTPALAAAFERGATRGGGDHHENFRVGGRLYMFLSMPVEAAGVPARFLGLYRVGTEFAGQIRARTLWSAIAVVVVVLVTTAVLIPVILALERRVVRFASDAVEGNIDTLAVLGSAIAKRDSDTDAHNYRVTLMAIRLGETVGLGAADMRKLIIGAFLHDVGKIGIPDHILLKPGRLTEDEFEVMKTHVRHGLDIVSTSRWLNVAADVVANHHEKYDGTGYPRGVKGDAIPMIGRVFAVVDVFDALTSRRPYKEPWSCDAACTLLIEGQGTHFDPVVVEHFLRALGPTWREIAEQPLDVMRDGLRAAINVYFPQVSLGSVP